MKIFKTILTVLSADILAIFIGFTLSASAMTIFRILSAVCTVGILICILGNFAYKTAVADKKSTKKSPAMPLIMAVSASLPSIVSWLILRFSDIDFYRWNKLINGFFLQIYNFINPDASSTALTSPQIMTMLPLAFVPAVVFISGYALGISKNK